MSRKGTPAHARPAAERHLHAILTANDNRPQSAPVINGAKFPVEDRSGIPIVIGTAGHRHLRDEDIDPLRGRVRRILDELAGQFPHSRFAILSPLGEGADRLIAEVALEAGPRFELLVPLAWSRRLGVDGLHRSGAPEPFHALLNQARSFSLPLCPDTSIEKLRESAAHRERQCDQVGAYIARHAQILIAIWDGQPRAESNTARLIDWLKRGVSAPHAALTGPLDDPECGCLYQIIAGRAGEPAPAQHLAGGWQDEEGAGIMLGQLASLDRFNRAAGRQMRARPGAVEESARQLYAIPPGDSLPAPLLEMRRIQGLADQVATQQQCWASRMVTWLFLLVGLAALCFSAYAHLWPNQRALLVADALALTAAVAVFAANKLLRLESRYLDARALAEALRVQFFWCLAGITESAASFYLRNLRSDLDWIRICIRNATLASGCHDEDGIDGGLPPARLASIRLSWLKDQEEYFCRRGPGHERRHHTLARASEAAVLLAIVLTLGLLWGNHEHLHERLTLVAVFAVLGALIHDFAEKRAYRHMARRYHWMQTMFRRAGGEIERAGQSGDADRARSVLLEIGREALLENASWVITHRERPLEFSRLA